MRRIRFYTLLFVIVCSQAAWAADTEPSIPAAPSELTQARQLIGQKDWTNAVNLLGNFTRANPGNADGFNLLGYSLRHLKRYDEALAAYNKALTIDPKHRGAHEYIGETYLQLGQFDKAKQHLDALDKICTFSCEEYRDLKKAYETASKAKNN